MNFRHIIIPIFIPHKGCPFDCIYCNQKTISGQVNEISEEEMRSIIDAHISSAPNDAFLEIGFYGGSFTGIDKAQQIKFLEIANEYIKKKSVKEIRLSTRPDYINVEILEYLKHYGVKTIELGVQSLDEEVLSQTNRGHNVCDVINSSQLIKDYGFKLGIQTMIGLPGDTMEKDIMTAKKVIELAPGIIRIYPTLVIKGTYLEKIYFSGQYSPLSINEAVGICARLLEMYEENDINVIRIGLQATDNINEGADVAAGPFHPAFRQLVEARLCLEKMEKYICEHDLAAKGSIIILTNQKNISNIIGQGRENMQVLKSHYSFRDIKVISDNAIEARFKIFPG